MRGSTKRMLDSIGAPRAGARQPKGFPVVVARQDIKFEDYRLIHARKRFGCALINTKVREDFSFFFFQSGYFYVAGIRSNIAEWLEQVPKWQIWMSRSSNDFVMKIIFAEDLDRIAFQLKWMNRSRP